MHAPRTQESGLDEPIVRSRFFSPPEEFAGCFTTYYHMEVEVPEGEKVLDYLQPEWGTIRFFSGSKPKARILGHGELSGARFAATGPSSRPAQFEIGSTRMWGIGFLPLGWARIVNVEARNLANQAVSGANHPAFRKFTALANILCDHGLSDDDHLNAINSLMRKLMKPHRDDQKILRIHRALIEKDTANVADFADRAGVNIRTLERVCGRHFGFTPKLLLRRQRFMRSLATFLLYHPSNWTSAMDQHYHDQAQFTREFREFMTMNPSEYAALDHPILKSLMEARARIKGSPAMTLDSPD